MVASGAKGLCLGPILQSKYRLADEWETQTMCYQRWKSQNYEAAKSSGWLLDCDMQSLNLVCMVLLPSTTHMRTLVSMCTPPRTRNHDANQREQRRRLECGCLQSIVFWSAQQEASNPLYSRAFRWVRGISFDSWPTRTVLDEKSSESTL